MFPSRTESETKYCEFLGTGPEFPFLPTTTELSEEPHTSEKLSSYDGELRNSLSCCVQMPPHNLVGAPMPAALSLPPSSFLVL